MKKLIILIIMSICTFIITKAQNDTLYIMKYGDVVAKYNIYTDLDSIIFYSVSDMCPATVTDIDGNVYDVVQVGNACITVQNLRTTRLNDGTIIPLVSENDIWKELDTPGYCWYDNDSALYHNAYGMLYNWYAVQTNKLCPDGWQVPSHYDFQDIISYIESQGYLNSNIVGGAGDAVKSCLQVNAPDGGHCNTTEHPRWNAHEKHKGLDVFGLSMLPGGQRTHQGGFVQIGRYSDFWANTIYYDWAGYTISIRSDVGQIRESASSMRYGLSVRCMKIDN